MGRNSHQVNHILLHFSQNTNMSEAKKGTFAVKVGLAQMLKGGVIMDVIDVEQARIAEEAGACAVMALERVPADIRRDGGVARMSDPKMIKAIKAAMIRTKGEAGTGNVTN